ncbi:hypothetical protein EXT65_20985 [Pectobacterium carotovorum subsp. carotovorum]|nr:hypothetical protein [Pectobacterium carotovorum]MCL6336271.1 hypothetical protein [Pectobacterium carotovorum subsp. carotovorum]
MNTKIIGLLLIIVGSVAGVILWYLTRKETPTIVLGTTKKYKLLNEFNNKGITEKGQSEGVKSIPQDITSSGKDEVISDANYGNDNITPGDNF